jgi:hypothetical protein
MSTTKEVEMDGEFDRGLALGREEAENDVDEERERCAKVCEAARDKAKALHEVSAPGSVDETYFLAQWRQADLLAQEIRQG